MEEHQDRCEKNIESQIMFVLAQKQNWPYIL